MSAETITIRRYPNRRLYDRSGKRYVTIGDIEEMVLQGKTIEVLDSKTGEDLTRPILTQILMERHPEKMNMIPVAMLHSLLRANDLVLEFWRSYLRNSMAVLEGLPPSSPFSAPMGWMNTFFPPMMPAAGGPGESSDAMRERLAELEARLQRLEAGVGSDRPSTSAEESAVDRLERRVRDLETEASRSDRNRGRRGPEKTGD